MIRIILFLLVTGPFVLIGKATGFVWGCLKRSFITGRDDLLDDFSDWADDGDL